MQKAKIIAALIGAVALVAVAIFVFTSLRGPTYDYLNDGDIIVGIGDSITAGGKTNEDFAADEEGYFNNLGEGYFKIVSDELQENIGGLTFYNSARSGITAEHWTDRINIQCLNWEPNIVIISLGANDFLFSNVGSYIRGLSFISDTLFQNDVRVVMILPFIMEHYEDYGHIEKPIDFEEMQKFYDEAVAISSGYGFEAVDIGAIFNEYIENGTDPKDLSEDGIHPTDFGEEILAQAVLEAINNF